MSPRFRDPRLGPIISIIPGTSFADSGRDRGKGVHLPHTVVARSNSSGATYTIVVDGNGRYSHNADYDILEFVTNWPKESSQKEPFDATKPFKTRSGLDVTDFREGGFIGGHKWAGLIAGASERTAVFKSDGTAWKGGVPFPHLDLVNLPEPLPARPTAPASAAPAEVAAPAAPPELVATFLAAIRGAALRGEDEVSDGQMIVLTPDGECTAVSSRRLPGLGKLRRAVGGDVKPVPMFDTFDGVPCVALAGNEDGCRVNRQATEAWLAALDANGNVPMFTDDLKGAVVILTGAAMGAAPPT